MWNTLKQRIESYSPAQKRYKLAREWALNRVCELEKEMPFEKFFHANTCRATREETLLKGCYSVQNYVKTHREDTTEHIVIQAALSLIDKHAYEVWAQTPEGRAAIEKALNDERKHK